MTKMTINKLKDKAVQILKENSYRITAGKVNMLYALLKEGAPLTVEQIYANLESKLDIVTVYRAINSFVEKGIVKKINLGDLASYYEIDHADHHHHHIICNSCGLVEDIEDCHTANLEAKTLQNSKSFKVIKSHSLEFFGVCRKCV